MRAQAEAIEKTIRYGDHFQFPLREEELRQYLIGEKLGRAIPPGRYRRIGEYFVLPGREELLTLREKRNRYTKKKVARAIKIANLLRIFPGVRLVGLTGSVAARNASKNDDIDLMIVTAKDRIWLTRAIILGFLSLVGLKRPDRAKGHFRNQFCFNLWLEESSGGLKMKNEDLYTAYEVCLMKPLLGGKTYLRFLEVNSWRRKFLPNFTADFGLQHIQDSTLTQDLGHVAQYLVEIPILYAFGWVLEPLARYFSKKRIAGKHARGYHTGVIVTDRQLLFHPESPRLTILAEMS